MSALVDALGEHADRIVVVGGLIPELLVSSTISHRGTSDVDIVVPLAATIFDRDGDDFGWLEAALVRAGFVVDTAVAGWRWLATLSGEAVVASSWST